MVSRPWLLALIIATLAARSADSAYSNSFTLPGVQSTQAIDLLKAVSPKVAGDSEEVVFQTSHGMLVTDQAVPGEDPGHARAGSRKSRM